jgi:hypothetical protein
MTEIDTYLTELAARLRVGGRARRRILTEVRDHLDDATDRERLGEDPDGAAVRALDAFGPAPALATQLNAETGVRAMRCGPWVAFAAGFTVFAGLFVAGSMQPHAAVPTKAILATQISFFVAILAFQVAVVAGICAAARVLAVWRAPAASAHDRAFVRGCVAVSTGALGVAATGWMITLGVALNRMNDPNRAAAVVGGIIMMSGAVGAIVTTRRLRMNVSDNVTGAQPDPGTLFGLAERSIEVVRRHPVVSCTAVAALSAWPAMAHAETTFTGALPWGVIQAATVVLAFVVLGPAPGLRRPVSRPTSPNPRRTTPAT